MDIVEKKEGFKEFFELIQKIESKKGVDEIWQSLIARQ